MVTSKKELTEVEQDAAKQIAEAIEKHASKPASAASVNKGTDSEGPKTSIVGKLAASAVSVAEALAKVNLTDSFVKECREAVKGYIRLSKIALQLYTVVSQYVALRGGEKGAKLEIYGVIIPELKGADRDEYRSGGKLSKQYEAIDYAYRKGQKEYEAAEEARNAKLAHEAVVKGFIQAGSTVEEAEKLAKAAESAPEANPAPSLIQLAALLLVRCTKTRDEAYALLLELHVEEGQRTSIMKKVEFPTKLAVASGQ